MKKYLSLIIAIVITITIFTPAFAIPTLQLYIPDAVYYETSPWFPADGETWITTSNPFDLWVAGATSPKDVKFIDEVQLHIALLQNEYPQNPDDSILTIMNNDSDVSFTSKTLYARDFIWGTSLIIQNGIASRDLPEHGIYDTYYFSLDLPDLLVAEANEIVKDYSPGGTGSDTGDIQHYTIDYDPRFSFIHFDASGVANSLKKKETIYTEKTVFAPFSHDADTAPVPEPASLFLLGMGLLGLAGTRIRSIGKKKRGILA